MSEGGHLTITTRALSDEVELHVTDTGEGMDAETISRIFDPFLTTKPAGKGTGLGLSTISGVVEQSGGRIRCHSKPDEGAMFTVSFPRVHQPRPKRVPQKRARAGGTILVVKDEDQIRELACKVLSRAGSPPADWKRHASSIPNTPKRSPCCSPTWRSSMAAG